MDDNEIMQAVINGKETPLTDEDLRRLEGVIERMYPNNPDVLKTFRHLTEKYRKEGLVIKSDPGVRGQPCGPDAEDRR